MVVTALGYIDTAAMVGPLHQCRSLLPSASPAPAPQLLPRVQVDLCTALSIKILDIRGPTWDDAWRAAAGHAFQCDPGRGWFPTLFGLGISPFLPGWLGLTPPCRQTPAYFAIWSRRLCLLHHGCGHVPPSSGGGQRPDRQPLISVLVRAGCSSTSSSSTHPDAAEASPSGVPGWVLPG